MVSNQSGSAQFVPTGWYRAGMAPQDYDMGIDREVAHNGTSSGFIRSRSTEPRPFGTLMQAFKAEGYLGRRLRLSGYVRAEGVEGWAGLWMRVDGPTGQSLAFDNMQDRPIRGTLDWQHHEIVLDVAEGSTNIAFGALLAGKGGIWVDDFEFEVVGRDVPVTDMRKKMQELPSKPRNLGFED
jgi:hypothetical protein